jgi:hypothetical protein
MLATIFDKFNQWLGGIWLLSQPNPISARRGV